MPFRKKKSSSRPKQIVVRVVVSPTRPTKSSYRKKRRAW